MKPAALLLAVVIFGGFIVQQLYAQTLIYSVSHGAQPNQVASPTPSPPPGVNLTPSSFPGTYANIQAAINAFPNGNQRFNFACGVYRFPTTGDTTLSPKNGDSFIGQNASDLTYPSGEVFARPSSPPCAEFTGAQVVSGWSGSNPWTKVITGTFSSTSNEGCNTAVLNSCVTGGCSYPQDLFYTPVGDATPIQDAVLKRRTLTNPPPAGFWYFDYPTNTVKVGDNPTGFVVEITQTPQAFSVGSTGCNNGSGPPTGPTNITVQNLTIDKFATPNQAGVIEIRNTGWHVWNNWVTHGHGEGPKFRPGASSSFISYNEIPEMGQGGGGAGCDSFDTFDHNEILRSNEDSVCYGQENGTKFSASNGGNVISNNRFIANNGVGLWGDVGNNGTFDSNVVMDNIHDGIRWETSHVGTISNNTVTDNAEYHADQCVAAGVPDFIHTKQPCTGKQQGATATGCSGTGFSRELAIVNSDSATVVNNTITTDCSGIVIIGGNGVNEKFGTRIKNNTMIFNGLSTSLSTTGLGGGTSNTFPLYTDIKANSSDPMWVCGHSYALRAEIKDANGNLQRVTTAGTSAACPSTHPTWGTTLGATTPDGAGALVWTATVSNYFTGNTYTWNTPTSGSANNWTWQNDSTNADQLMNFATWQSLGQDNP